MSGPGITVSGSGTEGAALVIANAGTTSFNTRVGEVSLTDADVTNALTYTPLDASSFSNLTWENTNQRLGIGSTSPQAALDLTKIRLITTNAYGQISMARTDGALACYVEGSSASVNLRYTGGNRGKLTVGSTLAFYGNTDTTLRMILDGTTGNLGIAIATPTEKLHVGGNVKWTGTADGDGSFITNLDYDNIALLNKPITPYAIPLTPGDYSNTFTTVASWTQAASISTIFKLYIFWSSSTSATPQLQITMSDATANFTMVIFRGASAPTLATSSDTTTVNLNNATIVAATTYYSLIEGVCNTTTVASTMSVQVKAQASGTLSISNGALFVQKLGSTINIT
jgi:hypothetical protein